jgi:hypothetical protein
MVLLAGNGLFGGVRVTNFQGVHAPGRQAIDPAPVRCHLGRLLRRAFPAALNRRRRCPAAFPVGYRRTEIPFPFRVTSRICEEENFPPSPPPLAGHDPIERHPEVRPSGAARVCAVGLTSGSQRRAGAICWGLVSSEAIPFPGSDSIFSSLCGAISALTSGCRPCREQTRGRPSRRGAGRVIFGSSSQTDFTFAYCLMSAFVYDNNLFYM